MVFLSEGAGFGAVGNRTYRMGRVVLRTPILPHYVQ